MTAKTLTRIRLLGLRICPMRAEELLAQIRVSMEKGARTVIVHHNLHSLYLLIDNQALRCLYDRADIAYVDGMSLVLIARLYGYHVPSNCRTTCVDYLPELMKTASHRGWRVYFLGGRRGVFARAMEHLQEESTSLDFAHRDGYFDASPGCEENRMVLEDIRRFRPDLVLVGMGMPRQERWVLQNLGDIHAGVVMTVGACLDYHAGEIPTPPRWSGRLGLEWLFRLLSEPRRLGSRYLVEPWWVAMMIAMDLLRGGRRRSRAELE